MREITCNRDRIEYRPLRNELEGLENSGVQLMLEGAKSTPENIAKRCILDEDCNYMRDYVTDEYGNIIRVDFTRIQL